MEVENVGKNPLTEPVNKKVWIVVFSIFGVAIVGLAVAIVVVLATRNLPKTQVEEEIGAAGEYYATSSEIWNEIVNNNAEMSKDEILAAYEKKIEAATDEDVKLMLTMEYYGFVIMYDTEGERKDEIIEAMLAADAKLKTPLSASNIIAMAISYGDQELEEKYEVILDERISAMEESVANDDYGEGTN